MRKRLCTETRAFLVEFFRITGRLEECCFSTRMVTGTGHKVTLYIHRLSCVTNVGEEDDRSLQRVPEQPEDRQNSPSHNRLPEHDCGATKGVYCRCTYWLLALCDFVSRSDFALRISPSHLHERHDANSPFPRAMLVKLQAMVLPLVHTYRPISSEVVVVFLISSRHAGINRLRH